jgi:hypothetical protein
MRDVAVALSVSRSRVFTIEHSDHVTARMTKRYLEAVQVANRSEKEETATDINGGGLMEATDVCITGPRLQQG